MDKYKVDYYEQKTRDRVFYLMEASVPDETGKDVNLIACIDPRDYDVDGFIEDENGAYFDEEIVEEACFKVLRDEILREAKYRHVDPESLIFSRLRFEKNDLSDIAD